MRSSPSAPPATIAAAVAKPTPGSVSRFHDPVHSGPALAVLALWTGTVLLAVHADAATTVAVCAVTLLATALLWTAWRTLRRQLDDLAQALHLVAAADFQRTPQRGRDGAMAPVWRAVEAVAASMSTVVAQVKSEGVIVASEGQALLERARDLAARTQQQAVGLEQSAAAVQQLSESVARSAQAVGAVDSLASQVRASASLAQTSMGEAVASVSRISAGSQRVAETVAVIDTIAFQTNLLALNAGVEAARAGDAGRGFSVVASEVRALAKRCADSAAEVREVMRSTSLDVRQGISTLAGAEQQLTDIVGAIGHLSTQSSAIAMVAQEQGGALAQVSDALRQVDHATQHNAGLVDLTAQSAQVLTNKAGRLAQSVAHARLRQGTADEAYALVQRAIARVQAIGYGPALREFHDPNGDFIDRDLYLIVSDRRGRYAAFGARPDMVGRQMSDMPNFDAERFLADASACADAGGGWVEFKVTHPATGALQEKISWFMPLGQDQLIGCGVFKQAAADPSAVR